MGKLITPCVAKNRLPLCVNLVKNVKNQSFDRSKSSLPLLSFFPMQKESDDINMVEWLSSPVLGWEGDNSELGANKANDEFTPKKRLCARVNSISIDTSHLAPHATDDQRADLLLTTPLSAMSTMLSIPEMLGLTDSSVYESPFSNCSLLDGNEDLCEELDSNWDLQCFSDSRHSNSETDEKQIDSKSSKPKDVEPIHSELLSMNATLATEQSNNPKKRTRVARKRTYTRPARSTDGHGGSVKRPRNAFIIYRNENTHRIVCENPEIPFAQLSRAIGEQWRQESEEVRGSYYRKADEEKAELLKMYPDFKFQKRHTDEIMRRKGTKSKWY